MKLRNVLYLPSGRVFLHETDDGYLIESTEMRDVSVDGKLHAEVRETMDPRVIWKHLKAFEEKWLLTVSTQKGCPYRCTFCDVADLPFRGNLRQDEIEAQIRYLIRNTPYVRESRKVKIGFARMGEPSHNLDAVVGAIQNLPTIAVDESRELAWLPCFNSILPRDCGSYTGLQVIDKIIDLKENYLNGQLHFQISCNSTCEETRKRLFDGASVISIPEIIEYLSETTITNRTITLNFIVMDGMEVDVSKLMAMGLDPERFRVKLIPLNKTFNAETHGLESYADYGSYEKLEALAEQFETAGVPVVFDAIAKCEEAGLCCGQIAQTALI